MIQIKVLSFGLLSRRLGLHLRASIDNKELTWRTPSGIFADTLPFVILGLVPRTHFSASQELCGDPAAVLIGPLAAYPIAPRPLPDGSSA